MGDDRGIEDLQWWSVLKLGTAQRLFDTYVPLLHFSISRETATERYIGLEVPPDDTRDGRLKEAHVVGVLEYASEDAGDSRSSHHLRRSHARARAAVL